MRSLVPALLFTLSACGGGDSPGTDSGEDTRTPLTCAVLADADFCWNTQVAEAYACIADTNSSGTFDSARGTCTLGDGSTVVFDDPVPADPFADSADDYLWTFTVNDASGSQCMRFVDSDEGMELTTSSGTASQRGAGMLGIEMECPDGELFFQGDAFSLFECEEDVTLPGYGYTGNVSWQLLGGPDGRFNLFDCQ